MIAVDYGLLGGSGWSDDGLIGSFAVVALFGPTGTVALLVAAGLVGRSIARGSLGCCCGIGSRRLTARLALIVRRRAFALSAALPAPFARAPVPLLSATVAA